MRREARHVLVALALAAAACGENQILAPDLLEDAAAGATYYPGRGEAWETRDPIAAGFDAGRLEEAIELAQASEADTPTDLRAWLQERNAGLPDQQIVGSVRNRGPMNGMVVRNGYLVAEWGDTEQVDMAFSVTKTFLATLVGLALDQEKIPALDARVGELVDDGGYASAQNAPITWEMSLRQTSEWEGTLFDKPDTADRREGRDRRLRPPGTFWEYNDVRVNRLALSALRVWKEPLPDVLDREVMTPIGASRTWRWHGYRNSDVDLDGESVQSVSGGGHWGGGLWIHSRDLARFGLLHLRGGRWREERLLSEEWMAAATSPGELNPSYGYMWWVNAGRELWPSLPESAYAARGGGDHILLVVPSHDMVVVVRWIERGTEDELFGRLLGAIDAPAADDGDGS